MWRDHLYEWHHDMKWWSSRCWCQFRMFKQKRNHKRSLSRSLQSPSLRTRSLSVDLIPMSYPSLKWRSSRSYHVRRNHLRKSYEITLDLRHVSNHLDHPLSDWHDWHDWHDWRDELMILDLVNKPRVALPDFFDGCDVYFHGKFDKDMKKKLERFVIAYGG